MRKTLGLFVLLLLPICMWAANNPADKVEYIQAGNDKYYVKDVAVPKVSKAVDADPSDAVDVGGGTKGTKVNKPKTTAVLPAQRVPTEIVPANNPKEVQLKGGAKVVTPHNSSPKVAMPKGKPMPMVPSSKPEPQVVKETKPTAQTQAQTVTQPKAQVKAAPATPAPKEQKLTPEEVKKIQSTPVTQAPAPVDEKYARPKKVHLKDYQVEFFCDRNGKSVRCTEAEWNKEQEAKKAPKPAKATKPTRTGKGSTSVKVSTPTGPTMTGNGVIIPAQPLKYGIKTKCVPLPGKTTCEEEKTETKPTNKLAGYKPSAGVELPEATIPEGVRATESFTNAKPQKDKVETPQRRGMSTKVSFEDQRTKSNLLQGYEATLNSNVEIPEASLPSEAELDEMDARARAEMETEQLLAEIEYKKAQAAAQQAKAQAQAAQAAKQQQQNTANLTCSYMGTYFRGNTCQYCVNHKPSNAMECNQCCQSFGRPLMQPASYRAFSSGGRPAGCLCRFGPTSGYNF